MRNCPSRTSLECLSFPLLELTLQTDYVTRDVILRTYLALRKKLYYCSECTNVFEDTGHGFALPIGTIPAIGGAFIPDRYLRHSLSWE